MPDKYSTYKIWAPDDSLWARWAKPVLFSREPMRPSVSPVKIPAVKWAPVPGYRTALIVDLPGASGVAEGLALGQLGYRPVPLYNGVYGPNRSAMAIDVTDIVSTLFRGAPQLAAMPVRQDAPPAFLLDSERTEGVARPWGKYDNRWCIFPQDMPSAAFLAQQGIQQVYVRADSVQNDLTHILRRYQEAEISIYQVDSTGNARRLTVVRPSYFKGLLYRIKTMAGLTRNAAGGFGGKVPEPTQSSGGRYYGIG